MNWRAIPEVPYETWAAVLRPKNDALAVPESYRIVRAHSAICLAQLLWESGGGTSPLALAADNPLGLRPRPDDNGPVVAGPFRKFEYVADALTYWFAKITAPTYAYAGTVTLEDYIHVYSPDSDNHPGQEAEYVAHIRAKLTEWGVPDQQTGGTVPTPTGHVPQPPMIIRDDLGKNHNRGQGRDGSDSQRWGLIVGSADHTSQGSFAGNLSVYSDPSWGGLTDYQVGGPWDGQNDGVIMRFIDPTSGVVPWANGVVGSAVAPFGDAPRFLAAFGVGGVNTRLRSIETTDGGVPDRTKGGRQIESLCFLHAYIHAEEAGQTSETFDFNMHHREFGGDHQACPGDWIIENVDYIQFRSCEIMDYFQFGKKLSAPLLVTYPPGWDGPDVPLPDVTPAPPKPTKPPTSHYPRPILPAELVADMKAGVPKDHVVNGITYKATKNAYRATRRTRRMQQPIEATKKVVVIGPSIEPNTALTAWWETGKTLITAHGTSLYKPAFRLIKTGIKGPVPSAEKPVAGRK